MISTASKHLKAEHTLHLVMYNTGHYQRTASIEAIPLLEDDWGCRISQTTLSHLQEIKEEDYFIAQHCL